MKLVLFVLIVIFLGLGIFFFAISSPISQNVSQLSLQEALGQMVIIGFEGTAMNPELESLMREVKPGGVLLLGRNIVNERQLAKLTQDLQKISMEYAGVPLFVAVDQEGGLVSRVPFAEHTKQSALQNYEYAFSVGRARAQDLQKLGINMNLAPVLDSNHASDFIYSRSFQKSPEQFIPIANGLVEGHQQQGVIAVPKHIPGYDGISYNPEEGVIPAVYDFPDLSSAKKILEDTNAPFAMISHVVYNNVDQEYPLPLSSKGLKLVQDTVGGDVLFMSDDLSSKSLMSKYSFEIIGSKAVEAGVDVLLVGGYPDPALVSKFHDALSVKLAEDQRKLAGLGWMYRLFYGKVAQELYLQDKVYSSAEKILALKKEMLK